MNIEKVSDLPICETDIYEFKSSETTTEAGKKKLGAAVSGFSNSGGGYFVIGINNDGIADGGWPTEIGRQPIGDWIDNVINRVEPTPKYEYVLLTDATDRGTIDSENVVVVVEVFSSSEAPHMAPDNKYYIRAGAHTVPARAFMIEALWAKRRQHTPVLSHLVRLSPERQNLVQLGVVAAVDSAALDVQIFLTGCGDSFKQDETLFPLNVRLIDKLNPFFFNVTFFDTATEDFPDSAMIRIEYKDLAGNEYSYQSSVGMEKSVPPFNLSEYEPTPFGSVSGKSVNAPRSTQVRPG